MSDCEREILRIIRESKDPSKAADIAMDILSRCVAGESMGSITVSYGNNLQEAKA